MVNWFVFTDSSLYESLTEDDGLFILFVLFCFGCLFFLNDLSSWVRLSKHVEIHLSTQAPPTARAGLGDWYILGVKSVYCEQPSDLFVHGSAFK